MAKPKKHWEPAALERMRETREDRTVERRLLERITPASPLAWQNQLHSTWLAPHNERTEG